VIACFAASCARPPTHQQSSNAHTEPLFSLARLMDPSLCRNQYFACRFTESWMMSRF
jgi:hypothetical protein